MNLDSVWTRLGQQFLTIRRTQVYSINSIFGHAPKRGDLLHRHYVSLDALDVADPLAEIQAALLTRA